MHHLAMLVVLFVTTSMKKYTSTIFSIRLAFPTIKDMTQSGCCNILHVFIHTTLFLVDFIIVGLRSMYAVTSSLDPRL